MIQIEYLIDTNGTSSLQREGGHSTYYLDSGNLANSKSKDITDSTQNRLLAFASREEEQKRNVSVLQELLAKAPYKENKERKNKESNIISLVPKREVDAKAICDSLEVIDEVSELRSDIGDERSPDQVVATFNPDGTGNKVS